MQFLTGAKQSSRVPALPKKYFCWYGLKFINNFIKLLLEQRSACKKFDDGTGAELVRLEEDGPPMSASPHMFAVELDNGHMDRLVCWDGGTFWYLNAYKCSSSYN